MKPTKVKKATGRHWVMRVKPSQEPNCRRKEKDVRHKLSFSPYLVPLSLHSYRDCCQQWAVHWVFRFLWIHIHVMEMTFFPLKINEVTTQWIYFTVRLKSGGMNWFFFPPPPIIDLTSRLQNPITRLSNRAPTIQLQVQKFCCKTSKVLGP